MHKALTGYIGNEQRQGGWPSGSRARCPYHRLLAGRESDGAILLLVSCGAARNGHNVMPKGIDAQEKSTITRITETALGEHRSWRSNEVHLRLQADKYWRISRQGNKPGQVSRQARCDTLKARLQARLSM
ncbi:hypothetical protein RRF57_010725 [Xylaria bambusicola]|uniref:Uncharacterized protein n=1 Tax=Xylaria bambusicola TaxID=326684 RepID=A0AAN7UX21_9PEZI